MSKGEESLQKLLSDDSKNLLEVKIEPISFVTIEEISRLHFFFYYPNIYETVINHFDVLLNRITVQNGLLTLAHLSEKNNEIIKSKLINRVFYLLYLKKMGNPKNLYQLVFESLSESLEYFSLLLIKNKKIKLQRMKELGIETFHYIPKGSKLRYDIELIYKKIPKVLKELEELYGKDKKKKSDELSAVRETLKRLEKIGYIRSKYSAIKIYNSYQKHKKKLVN